MGKAKKKAERNYFLVRLPIRYKGPLDELAKRNRRTYTAELQFALDRHLAGEGGAK